MRYLTTQELTQVAAGANDTETSASIDNTVSNTVTNEKLESILVASLLIMTTSMMLIRAMIRRK